MQKAEEVGKKLENLGAKLLSEVEKKQSPTIEIPVRGYSNVEYDKKKKMLVLGEKVLKRTFMNVAHSKKFMQTSLVASYCYDQLIKSGLHCSLRDLFYALKRTLPNSNENTFDEQEESNPCLVDLEVALDVLREELHLNATPRGRIVGPATIVDRGDTIDWSHMGSGGWAIPSNVEDITFKKVDADYALVVEKYAAFDRLNEDKFWKKQNCVLITTEGQSPRGTRRLIQRLSTEHDLPIYVFTDADGYGWYIYSVIKFGSMALAHTSDRLGTTNAKFLGLTLTDVEKYDLKKHTIKADLVDLKRTKEIMDYEWFKAPEWQKELRLALDTGLKAEIEALTSKGIKYITTDYLPEKIAKKDFLP